MGKIKNSLQVASILILISATAFAQGRPAIQEKISGALRYWDGGLANNVKAITSNKPKATITSLPKGIHTGLTGYCDFQVNGGSPKYIAINPANPKRVHTTYMSADQGDVYGTRHVGYAYSSKDGFEWESYSSVRQAVTNTYVAFPSLTLLQSQSGNAEVAIACSYTKLDNSGQLDSLRSLVFIDQYDEGVALFSQVSPSSSGFGKFQPIWPSILASNDGSKIWMMATNPGNYTSYYTVWDNASKKFGAYVGPLKTSTGYFLRSYGLYGMAISESGNKVAMCYIDVAGYINLNYTESTDGGQTFPDFTTLTPYPTVINGDTLTVFAGGDAVYVGEDLHIVFSSCKPYYDQKVGAWRPDITGQGIWHWSQSTGFTRAVDTTKIKTLFGSNWEGYRMPSGGKLQANTLPIDYPSIGTGPDGSLFCVFQVARRQKSSSSFNYYTVLYMRSTDGGLTWSAPVQIETDEATDFRYPSLAKYNPAGYVNVVYQMDSEPGSGAFGDGAPLTQASLLFAKLTADGVLSTGKDVNSKVTEYQLEQNYPNPFNPTTTIGFSLPKAEKVEIEVYDILGRKVATLLNERQSAGQHQVVFDAKRIGSGIYFYRLRAGSFSETKKMVFVK